MKSPFLSKTLWMNALLSIAAFVPGAQDWLTGHSQLVFAFWGVANMALRFFTKDQIGFGE